MFLLGLAAIVQIVFLPGYLALRLMRIRLGFFGALIGCFGLSLIINHFLVWGLVLTGVYRSGVIYGVFATECLLWFVLNVNVRKRPAQVPGLNMPIAEVLRRLGKSIQSGCADFLPRDLNDKPGLLRMAVLLTVVGLMIGYVIYETVLPDRIFTEWDAVVSWNRWAGEWAQNGMPRGTGEYPQLLPANLSLSYVFIQDTRVWFFAKAIMFLFGLGTLLAILDLGLKTDQVGYLLGVFFTFLLFHAILRARNLSSGYADVPVAFFAFGTVYFLLVGQVANLSHEKVGNLSYFKTLLPAALFAAGCALTKQTGLYLAAVFPLLAYLTLSRRERAGVRAGDKESPIVLEPFFPYSPHPNPLRAPRSGRGEGNLKPIIFAALLAFLLIAPWYLYKQWDIRYGDGFTNTAYLLTGIHEGRSAWQRLLHAGVLLREALSPPGAVFWGITLLAAVRHPVGRRFVLILVLPITLIWSFAFSYDTRNLALILPFAGVASGLGLMETLQAVEGWMQRRGTSLWRWTPNLLRACLENLPSPFGRGVRGEGCIEENGITGTIRPTALTLTLSQRERGPIYRYALRAPSGILLLLPILGLVILGSRFSPADLSARQEKLQRRIGLSDVNQRLYAYHREHGFRAAIASDYYCLAWLPELNRYCRACSTRDLPAFRAAYEDPRVGYALLHKTVIAPAVRDYIRRACDRGEVRVVFENRYYRLYEKLEKPKVEHQASTVETRRKR